jgi:hypothetical protein
MTFRGVVLNPNVPYRTRSSSGYTFLFTATGLEGDDFMVQLPFPLQHDRYDVHVAGTWLPPQDDPESLHRFAMGISTPDMRARDRTHQEFRVVTDQDVVVGTTIEFFIMQD